jgi:hypothetical protein
LDSLYTNAISKGRRRQAAASVADHDPKAS